MKQSNSLGEFTFPKKTFGNLSTLLKECKTKEFTKLNVLQKSSRIGEILLNLIQKVDAPCFLLPEVVDFIDYIDQEKIILGYSMSQFELWLNQFSGLSLEQEHEIRGKITGQYIPREEYQLLFPIGMQKFYEGSHFVTAHSSPDLDTIIASFWGWVDAFSAKVSKGLHIWNVPGGLPSSIIELEILFKKIFGDFVFEILAKTRTSLAVTGIDMVCQTNVIKKTLQDSTLTADHERRQNAIILTDALGFYLGDWRSFDVEGMRQVIGMVNAFLRWFEARIQAQMISLFAKKELKKTDIPRFVREIFQVKLIDCEPAHDLSHKQKENVNNYLIKVLNLKKGLQANFEDFAQALKSLGIHSVIELKKLLDNLSKSKLFDTKGKIVEDRPKIFDALKEIIAALQKAIFTFRKYVDSMEMALKIKEKVYLHSPQYVTLRSDAEEIKSKIQNYQYLTVVQADEKDRFVPVGVIYGKDMLHSTLGTVSVRDFSNRNEVNIPSYLEVISAVDHHKLSLSGDIPAMIYTADAQSANVLTAEKSMEMKNRYSLLGMSEKEIHSQLKALDQGKMSLSKLRLKRNLVQKLSITQRKNQYFVHPERELLEYLHYLYAILDDTDLLTKVSARDVRCVVQLLNRMRSILNKKQTEIIHLDDIEPGQEFAKKAAKKILQNDDLYSLYKKVYARKEKEVDFNITQCAAGKRNSFFADTKTQSGYCRIGQAKMFPKNIALFKQNRSKIQKVWYRDSNDSYKDHVAIDLFLQMVSTIPSSDEVYKGERIAYKHSDELWIWAPPNEQSTTHLKRFLHAFRDSPGLVDNDMYVEFLGANAKEFAQIFKESFLPVRFEMNMEMNIPIAVLHYRAGSMNSRKAMISPFLPKLVS